MNTYEFLVRKAISDSDYVGLAKTLLDIREKCNKGVLLRDRSAQREEDVPRRGVDSSEGETETSYIDPIPSWEKAYDEGVAYLQDQIDAIREMLQSNSLALDSTLPLIRAFSLLESVGREETLLLFEKMIGADEPAIRNAAFEALIEKRKIPDSTESWTLCDSPHLGDGVERILRSVTGIRLIEYLPRVITAAKNNEDLTERLVRTVIEPRSNLVRKNCDLVRKEMGKFFMAFANRAVKEVVADYFKAHSPAYEMQIAGESLGALTVSGEIVTKLLASAFAVFDLSPSKKSI